MASSCSVGQRFGIPPFVAPHFSPEQLGKPEAQESGEGYQGKGDVELSVKRKGTSPVFLLKRRRPAPAPPGRLHHGAAYPSWSPARLGEFCDLKTGGAGPGILRSPRPDPRAGRPSDVKVPWLPLVPWVSGSGSWSSWRSWWPGSVR